jgi:NAD(P)-dependent dehydrogenase (short-subunit alcohol dehydrogenase family)
MDIGGRVVVVTGGGGGIGRALCRAFAVNGAALVVVADIDEAAAHATAADIVASGGSARARRTDVAVAADVEGLVREIERDAPIELFCANAGILVQGGLESTDEQWQRMLEVNVMSHVYAARAVVPSMLARGEGYLLHTASAAGLLSHLGSVSYAVTKHSVVAFAEWLAITYGDAGIKVSCLCPQGVQTNMLTVRPDQPTASSPVSRDGILSPEAVADVVIAGLAAETFLILPHPEVARYERRRAEDRDQWLQGMRRARALAVEHHTLPDHRTGATS